MTFHPQPACTDLLAPVRGEHFKDPAGAMKRSLRSWLWRVPIDQEVGEEIAFHIEMRTRELIERGMDPKAARRMEPFAQYAVAKAA